MGSGGAERRSGAERRRSGGGAEEEEERRRRRRSGVDVKSDNPHVTGGEKCHKTWLNIAFFWGLEEGGFF